MGINSVDERYKTLKAHGDHLFTKRQPLLSLWQEMADNFYVERADFTVSRSLGYEFADHLMTSFPLMARRDLGNSFSAMLRRDQWFKLRAKQENREDSTPAKEWLEWATGVQYRAMYDRNSLFIKATKEGDHDYAAFGQCVISVRLNRLQNGLLYRNWHLRDVVWCEDEEGKVNTIHRNWKPCCRDLARLFPKTVAQQVRDRLEKEPYHEVNCRHIVIPSDSYEGKWKTPYVSIYLDCENDTILEETGQWTKEYVIPRWQTVSGSQYAYSPATVAALPDARLIQMMTRVLLEAGEKATNPPMVAVQEAIRGDVAIYAGGITWVDAQYDERLGEVLRPLSQDKTGIPTGLNMRDDIKMTIVDAFYLNKLNLPEIAGATAYEISQRVQEYIRQALPIFAPMESDYNGALCEETFDLLMRNGAFGPADNIPDEIRGADVEFRFESPLNAAIEKEKGQHFQEAATLLASAMQIDPTVQVDLDVREAFRDAVSGIGAPAKWLRDEKEADAMLEEQKQVQQAQALAQTISAGAGIAQQVGEAEKSLNEASVA
jgi:hypothetical protein